MLFICPNPFILSLHSLPDQKIMNSLNELLSNSFDHLALYQVKQWNHTWRKNLEACTFIQIIEPETESWINQLSISKKLQKGQKINLQSRFLILLSCWKNTDNTIDLSISRNYDVSNMFLYLGCQTRSYGLQSQVTLSVDCFVYLLAATPSFFQASILLMSVRMI